MKRAKVSSEENWLNLLEEAIKNGVKIQVNHRFKYKDRNLGTFLTGAKRNNKPELIKKIEALGLDFKMHSKDPEDFLMRYIKELRENENPVKQQYITRFNSYILPKKNILKKETKAELNEVWKEKFGDRRKWTKPETTDDKIRRWKAFRYDEAKNPDGKWFHYKRIIGKLYNWVYIRKTNPEKMEALVKYFNEQEIKELKKEGFFNV